VIDFRYHLVSLISVFLALALGIVLGAGPLREVIGDSVTGRTQQLEQQDDELRAQRDAAVADRDAASAALDAAGAGLLDGVLSGHRVAVVALGTVDGTVGADLDRRLAQAGATVTAHVTLAQAWTDPAQRSFRQGLVGYLLGYLDPAPPATASGDTELAQALVQGLVGADATSGTPSEAASVLLELLSTGDTPLVTLAAPVTAPADVVVLLAGGVAGSSATPAPTAAGDLASAGLTLAQAAQAGSSGAVLAEVEGGPGPAVQAVLDAPDVAAAVSTVSGAGGVAGRIGVPLALAQRVAGTAGHYGTGTGLTALPPRVPAPAAS
jgi:hypothetical protein